MNWKIDEDISPAPKCADHNSGDNAGPKFATRAEVGRESAQYAADDARQQDTNASYPSS